MCVKWGFLDFKNNISPDVLIAACSWGQEIKSDAVGPSSPALLEQRNKKHTK